MHTDESFDLTLLEQRLSELRELEARGVITTVEHHAARAAAIAGE
jgi:cytochrome c-type biogenesis protein CcmH/NrfG